VNRKGFVLLPVIFIILLVVVGIALLSRTRQPKQPLIENTDLTSEQGVTVSTFTSMTCENIGATFTVPEHFVKYEEVNGKGEKVCLISDKIQDGHVSPSRVYISVFATENTTSALGMTSKAAAERDTKQYGGITDLPEAVTTKEGITTFHVIAPNAHKDTAIWYVDSIANNTTDTFYTVTLSVPNKLKTTVNAQSIMEGYQLSSSY
jgi:hypothetical protein